MKDIFKIKIGIQDVGEFINAANSIPNDINVFQGNSVASGKSLIGIYSLNLNKPINLVVRDISSEDVVIDKFKKWLIF